MAQFGLLFHSKFTGEEIFSLTPLRNKYTFPSWPNRSQHLSARESQKKS
jgi:hypothetical protein